MTTRLHLKVYPSVQIARREFVRFLSCNPHITARTSSLEAHLGDDIFKFSFPSENMKSCGWGWAGLTFYTLDIYEGIEFEKRQYLSARLRGHLNV